MGNYTSSCFTTPPSKPKTVNLLDFRGNPRQVKVPVTAAELMLDEPGFVVSSYHELRRTGRVIALRAEDELLAGEIYLFVPLSRLNRKISESEMGIIESAAASVKMSRKRHRGAKVLPAVPVEAGEEVESEEADEILEVQDDGGFAGCRLKNYRHWTPVLEPISEEP